MPRKPRHEAPGAVHHVWARGVNKRTIFITEFDRRIYLASLGDVVVDWDWDCLAYCLMTNHVHLLIRTREPNLGEGMQRLHSTYAQEFNQRHGRVGHLFQGRFGSSRVRSGGKLLQTAEYIAQNPVRAGLSAAPQAWRWSSSGADAHGPRPPWLASAAVVASAADALDYGDDAPLRAAA